MTPEELLEELTVKIYEEPLSRIREDGSIRNIDDPLSVFALIVDFETERSMNGVLNCFGNALGLNINETISALTIIGAHNCAACLSNMAMIASNAGLDNQSIQADRAGQEPHSITTWSETHGSKWEQAEKQIESLDDDLNSDELWSNLLLFVTHNFELLSEKLQQAH